MGFCRHWRFEIPTAEALFYYASLFQTVPSECYDTNN
jgi:hypothetical protein